MSRVLLDTSALLYWTLRPEALPERARRAPADRVVVAMAEVLDVPVVTSDEAIRRYAERAIWA